MNFYPSIEEFKTLHEKYGRGYLSFKLADGRFDPISLFKKLRNNTKCFLLESVEQGKDLGRFSHIGRNPFLEVICKKDVVTVLKGEEKETYTADPIDALKKIMNQYEMKIPNQVDRFWGGAVGYVGYDTAKYAYKIFSDAEDTINTADTHLIFPEEIITYDNELKEIRITVHILDIANYKTAYETGINKLLSILGELNKENIVSEVLDSKEYKELTYTSNETLESYSEKVNKIKQHILEGDIFQCVISQRLTVETDLEPFKAYEALRKVNPSQYMFYLDFMDYQVLGSSPEMLTKVDKDKVMTCPIAGTRPRGKDTAEDLALKEDLLSDEKELAEHNMLVDLARNDIGKVAKFGTVNPDVYMDVKLYSHVMHIVSLISGEPVDNLHMLDGLVSCLPAGTLSGAPKKRAMEILNGLENVKRGIYGGAVGWFGFDNFMDTCIAIRTIVFKDQKAYIQAGAGVVHDSVPANEYEESMRKARGQISALEKAIKGEF